MPPGFHARAAERPWETGLGGHLDPGTVLHAPLGGLLDTAFVLAPAKPIDDQTMRFIATLALRSALLPPLPPGSAVSIRSDHKVAVNGGEVATARVARGPALRDGTPSWLVLGLTVRVALRLEAPGLTPGLTDLAEEGSAITSADLLEALCRHLLAAFDLWHESGAAGVAMVWHVIRKEFPG